MSDEHFAYPGVQSAYFKKCQKKWGPQLLQHFDWPLTQTQPRYYGGFIAALGPV